MLFLLLLTLSFGVRGQTPSSLLGPGHFSYHPIVRQYLEETSAAPTKQGPVVFPPSPSPPPQSLVVTPRTLNSQTASSAVSNVYRPFRYRPFVPVPYGDKTYDFEQPTLPPIYKALSNQANNNLIKVMKNNKANIRRPKNEDYQYNNLSSEDEQNQKYAFSYTVKDHKTGDDFSHSQHSSGSATNGEYRVRLPDGRTQIVSYTADENGYKADVRYDNDDSGFNANNYDNTIKYNANNNAASNNAYKFDVVNNNNNAVSNAYKFDVASNIGNKAVKYNAIDNYDANNNVASNNAYKINVGNNAIKYNTFDANNNNVYKQRLDTVYTDAIDSRNNDYDYKREEIPIKEEVNEYNDYSAEYNDKGYNTANKFAVYDTETKFVPTVRPSYEEIKDLFTKIHVKTPAYNFQVTPTPDYQKFNNEKVVVLGNRYTDVRSTLANYQNPTTPYFIPDPVTIKPILSQNYINRINKYLTFN